MKAVEVNEYLKTLNGGWVDQEKTVDTFKSGDPNEEITGIAVGWMSYTWALEKAKELNCNMFVTHEPTYYDHWDRKEYFLHHKSTQEKQQFIQDNKMIILRCHDLWDKYKDIGVPDSWGKMLGFKKHIAGDGYYRVYEVKDETAFSIAKQVARNTKYLGQEAVQLVGPKDKKVTRVAIGTGTATPFMRFIDDYDVDVAICSDDGYTYWRDGALSIDAGIPSIVVNHAVSEIYGIQLLAEHLREKFPNVPLHYIPQQCTYQLVSD